MTRKMGKRDKKNNKMESQSSQHSQSQEFKNSSKAEKETLEEHKVPPSEQQQEDLPISFGKMLAAEHHEAEVIHPPKRRNSRFFSGEEMHDMAQYRPEFCGAKALKTTNEKMW